MPHTDRNQLFLRTARISATVALVVVLVLIAWKALPALMLIFGAFLFAVLLSGLAAVLARHAPLGHKASLAVVGFVLLALVVGGFWLLGGTLTNQLAGVNMSLPNALDRLNGMVQEWTARLGIQNPPSVTEMMPSGGPSTSRVLGIVGGIFGILANLVVIVLVGAFFAAAPRTYKSGILHLMPVDRRARVGAVLDDVTQAVRKWLVARLIAMGANAVLTYIGLTIVGVPFTLGLALIAGLMAFIPYIGAYIGGAISVLVALSVSPQTALYTLIAYVIIENIQGWTIDPLVESRMTAAPPALLLTAQVILGTLLGIGGIILASPLAVALTVLVQAFYVQDVLGDDVSVLGEG